MKATPFHQESLRALASHLSSPRAGGQGASRKMSLVLAFRLAGGDLLFAADKRIVVKSENDVVVRRSSSATKLHAISGGVVAFAGNASLAQDLLLDLVLDEDAETDRMKQLIGLLRERFSRLASCYSDDDLCELLASDRERLFRLKSPHFEPMLVDGDYEAIGVTSLARLVCGMFHPERDLTLIGAQRLAALQIIVTAATDPTSVSEEMDMWLLRRGKDAPEVLGDVSSVREWVDGYWRRMLAEMHGLTLPT